MEKFKKETQQTDDLATYEGRAWEDLSDTELERISRDQWIERPGGDRNIHTRRGVKAFEVLLARREAMKSAVKGLQEKKLSDDGSVRALITNGGYNDIGNGVMVQKIFDGETAWTLKGGGMNSEAETVTKNIDEYNNFSTAEKVANDVRTFCRRKFKKEEIILCSIDSFYSTKNGIVFLEDRICSFNQKKLEYIITYAEMEDVDFDDSSVIIKVTGGEEAKMYCGGNEEYSKGVFNLLMDIKDRLAKA